MANSVDLNKNEIRFVNASKITGKNFKSNKTAFIGSMKQ